MVDQKRQMPLRRENIDADLPSRPREISSTPLVLFSSRLPHAGMNDIVRLMRDVGPTRRLFIVGGCDADQRDADHACAAAEVPG